MHIMISELVILLKIGQIKKIFFFVLLDKDKKVFLLYYSHQNFLYKIPIILGLSSPHYKTKNHQEKTENG
jgi:hypothetical protein